MENITVFATHSTSLSTKSYYIYDNNKAHDLYQRRKKEEKCAEKLCYSEKKEEAKATYIKM